MRDVHPFPPSGTKASPSRGREQGSNASELTAVQAQQLEAELAPFQELQQRLASAASELAGKLENTRRELEKERRAHRRTLEREDELKRELGRVRAQLHRSQETAKSRRRSLKDLRARLLALKSEHLDLQAQLQDLDATLTALRDSKSYQLGRTLVLGATSAAGFVALPVRLCRLLYSSHTSAKGTADEAAAIPRLESTCSKAAPSPTDIDYHALTERTVEITEPASEGSIETLDAEILSESLSRTLGSESSNGVLIELGKAPLAPESKATIAERLAREATGTMVAALRKVAFTQAPTRKRAFVLVREAMHYGELHHLEEPLKFLEAYRAELDKSEQRAIAEAEGYLSLQRNPPPIPPRAHLGARWHGPVAMIVHCSLPYVTNGYATRTHSLLQALSRAERRVIAITRPGFPTDLDHTCAAGSDVIDGVEYLHVGGADLRQDGLANYIDKAAAQLEDLLRQIRPSVVHAASAFTTGLPALIAARRLGVPFVYEVRGLWEITRASNIPGWSETPRFKLESDLEALVAREADHVLTITRGLKRELIRRGVSEEQISIAPNGVDASAFRPSSPDTALAKALGLRDAPTIGYVGSLVDYEGLDCLLEALRILRARHIEFNCIIVGDGAAKPRLERLAKELRLSDRVVFTGRVPFEMCERYYSLIDVAPFPRKPLPVTEIVSPLKPFEAMAKGAAVVASDVEALSELIDHGNNGFLFKKGSADDLAEKLRTLIENRSLLRKIRGTALQWVRNERPWSRTAQHIATVHDNLRRQIFDSAHCELKILVYGDVDLNLIDGSAIWAASLVEVLAGLPRSQVWLLLKTPLKRDVVVQNLLERTNVRLVSPEEVAGTPGRLTAQTAVDAISALHRQEGFDLVLLRGFDVCLGAAKRPEFYGVLMPYLVDVFQRESWDQDTVTNIRVIARASHTLLCQTDKIRARLERHLPEGQCRTTLLPPMVPRSPAIKTQHWQPGRPLRIVYAGKFAPLWGSRELFEIFALLRKSGFPCELHVYGDKIHNPSDDPHFRSDIESSLQSEGVVWHQAVPRRLVLEELPTYDLAWAWRQPELETSTDEISTKVLEYATAGLPILLLGSRMNKQVLGMDYPLFVDRYEDLLPAFVHISERPKILVSASKRAVAATATHTFEHVRESHLSPVTSPCRRTRARPTILVAGHDLKFMPELMRQFRQNGHRVLVDQWHNHSKGDPSTSEDLLSIADVVICEWCLGNAVWYSKNVRPNQRLLVRFHSQELRLDYPARVDFSRVSNTVFIAPHVQRKALATFGWAPESVQSRFIWNAVDTARYARGKTEDAPFTLGLVGVVPKTKRLDRALDLLELLAGADPRFTLRVKGKWATDYPWMAARRDELAYFEEQKQRIGDTPLLRNRVFFDGYDNDMENWFQRVGFVLSVSEYEGSHVSVAEGMASGAVPIIYGWDGADELYPSDYCFQSLEDAAHKALSISSMPTRKASRLRKRCMAYVKERCDVSRISNEWLSLIRASD